MRYLLLVILLCLSACEPVYAASVVSSGTFQMYTGSHKNDVRTVSGVGSVVVITTGTTSTVSISSLVYSNYSTSLRVAFNAATTKAVPVSADTFNFWDNVTGGLRKLTWSNIISALTTAFNSVYASVSTTVNGHALSSNVTVSATDISTGTLPHAQLPALVSGDIPNNAANTSGNASTATKLAATKTINGVAFDGSANIQTTTASTSDYNSGPTWTPTVTFSGGTTGITYTAHTGTYTKIGNMMTVTGYINLSNKGSSVGTLSIAGLPYSSNSAANTYIRMPVYATGLTLVTNSVYGQLAPGATTFAIYVDNQAQTAVTNTNTANATDISFTFSYITN